MKKIKAKDFLNHWLSFSNEIILNNPNWRIAWNSSHEWSKLILGTKNSSSSESPIGNYLATKYPQVNYRTEDGLFDLSITLNQNIFSIPTLDKNYNLTSFDSKDYASVYDILLEHENEIYHTWHEVAKLAYVRSYLKVVVTYNSDGLSESQLQKENEMMIKTFETIIPQCTANFADNEQTEYLLLIGNKTADTLNWTYKTFDCNGKLTGQNTAGNTSLAQCGQTR